MWLIIRDSDSAVVGTNYAQAKPGTPPGHTAKEWYGAEPPLHDPEDGVESYDPTLDDPAYVELVSFHADFDALAETAANEIAWLEDALDVVDVADLATLRIILKHVLRENLGMVKAWRYVLKRL